mgnify:CR=1 FL=1
MDAIDPSSILSLISSPAGAAAVVAVVVPFVLRVFVKPFLSPSMRLPGLQTMALYGALSFAIGVFLAMLMLAAEILQASFAVAVLVGLCGAWESVSRLMGTTIEKVRG